MTIKTILQALALLGFAQLTFGLVGIYTFDYVPEQPYGLLMLAVILSVFGVAEAILASIALVKLKKQ